MPPQYRWPRVASALPEGTLVAGVGYIVTGITAYLFLIVAARALTPEAYASMSGVWIVGLAGTAAMVPLEQEVARVIGARRVQGQGSLPVFQRAAALGLAMAAGLALLLVVVAGPVARSVFDGNRALVAALAVLWLGYAGEHVARGFFAGTRTFRPYAVLLSVESVSRLAAALVLWAAGVRSPVPYGFAIAVAPMVGVAVTAPRIRGLTAGPPVRWSEMSSRIGALVAASVGGQALIALPPLTVVALSEGRAARAGASAFFVGATVARVPLFLFSAVQASLLPKLAAFLSAGRRGDFRAGVLRLSGLVAAVVVAAVLGAAAVGPSVVRLVFGADFTLGRSDLVLLVLASGMHMLVVALCQALLAAHWDRSTALVWVAGVVTFVATAALWPGDPSPRAERAFVAGEAVAFGLAVAFLAAMFLRHAEQPDDVTPLVAELAEDTGPYTSMSPQA